MVETSRCVMRASRQVIFVQGGQAIEAKYAEALPSYSFPTNVCNSLHGFKRLIAVQKVFASVLVGEHHDPGAMANALRRLDPSMWIVYLHPAATASERIAALAAGADICLPDAVEAAELAATLQALIRRARADGTASGARRMLNDASAPPPAPGVWPPHDAHMQTNCYGNNDGEATRALKARPAKGRRTVSGRAMMTGGELAARAPAIEHAEGLAADLASVTDAFARAPVSAAPPTHAGWHLIHGGRSLSCRHGLSVALTPTERIFLARLLDSPDQPIHRVHVSDIGVSHDDDAASAIPTQRSVDVMLSRLRRKARDKGLHLPIKAVRGWGYMFATDTTRMPDDADDGMAGLRGHIDDDDLARSEAGCCALARRVK